MTTRDARERFVEIREEVLVRILRGTTIGSVLPLLIFVQRNVLARRWYELALVVSGFAGVAMLAFLRLPYTQRSRGLVGVVAVLALSMLAQQGYTPGPMVAGCAVPLLAVLFLGVRESVVLLLLWAIAVAAAGIAMAAGKLGLPEEVLLTRRYPHRWFFVLVVQLVLLLPVLLSTSAVLSRLERELAEKQAALERLAQAHATMLDSERLRTLGVLAGSLAHDLNNTLTVINGEAELLGENEGQGREAILEAAASAAALARQLLNVSGRAMAQIRTVPVATIVRTCSKMAQRVLPPNVTLIVHDDTKALVRVDAALLQQAVLNLVLNARDAMVLGGTITLSASRAPADEGESFVVLTVADDGPGMSDEVRARAFEPFFTTKGTKGTGLGLANVRATLEKLGGKVVLESTRGQGTRVALWLERGDVEEAPVDARDGGRGERVLLVEDDLRVRAVVFGILENAGYEVVEVGSVDAAESALRSGPTIDALVTDLVLPDGRGLDLARRARAKRPDIAALIISGFVPGDEEHQAIARGEFRFLTKPFTSAQVRIALRGAFDETAVSPAART